MKARRIAKGRWAKYLQSAKLDSVFPPLNLQVANVLDRLTVSPDQLATQLELVVIDNGGLFLAPDRMKHAPRQIDLQSPNGSQFNVSREAAGIVASLFVYSHVSINFSHQHAGSAYRLLRAYSYEHKDAKAITALID